MYKEVDAQRMMPLPVMPIPSAPGPHLQTLAPPLQLSATELLSSQQLLDTFPDLIQQPAVAQLALGGEQEQLQAEAEGQPNPKQLRDAELQLPASSQQQQLPPSSQQAELEAWSATNAGTWQGKDSSETEFDQEQEQVEAWEHPPKVLRIKGRGWVGQPVLRVAKDKLRYGAVVQAEVEGRGGIKDRGQGRRATSGNRAVTSTCLQPVLQPVIQPIAQYLV